MVAQDKRIFLCPVLPCLDSMLNPGFMNSVYRAMIINDNISVYLLIDFILSVCNSNPHQRSPNKQQIVACCLDQGH